MTRTVRTRRPSDHFPLERAPSRRAGALAVDIAIVTFVTILLPLAMIAVLP